MDTPPPAGRQAEGRGTDRWCRWMRISKPFFNGEVRLRGGVNRTLHSRRDCRAEAFPACADDRSRRTAQTGFDPGVFIRQMLAIDATELLRPAEIPLPASGAVGSFEGFRVGSRSRLRLALRTSVGESVPVNGKKQVCRLADAAGCFYKDSGTVRSVNDYGCHPQFNGRFESEQGGNPFRAGSLG